MVTLYQYLVEGGASGHMKYPYNHLNTLNESKGSLEYDDFVTDIINEIQDKKTGECITIKSAHYPKWLKELKIQITRNKNYNALFIKDSSNILNKKAVIELNNTAEANKDRLKRDLQHELKHTFDYFIGVYYKKFQAGTDTTVNNLNEFEEEYRQIIQIIIDISYYFNRLEISANQQEIIWCVKNNIITKAEINDYEEKIKNSSIENFIFTNVATNKVEFYLHALTKISYLYKLVKNNEIQIPFKDFLDLLESLELSERVLNKPFKGKTVNEVKALLLKIYKFGKDTIREILYKAVKNL